MSREKVILSDDGKYRVLKTFDGGRALVVKSEVITIKNKALASELLTAGFIAPEELKLKNKRSVAKSATAKKQPKKAGNAKPRNTK